MATYYVSETGTETVKGSVTELNPFSVAGFNAVTTFTGGDDIIFLDDGDITAEIAPSSSGLSMASKITMDFTSGVLVAATTGVCIYLLSVDYIDINSPRVQGNGDDSAIEAVVNAGAGGAADEITITINSPVVVSNGGGTNSDCDGIGTFNNARLIVNNPTVSNCFNTSSPTTGSHQALTSHDDSILVANTPTVNECTFWGVNTSNSRLIINGGSFKNPISGTFECGGDCTALSRLVVIDAKMENNKYSTAKHPNSTSTVSANAVCSIIGGKYTCTAGKDSYNRSVTSFLNVKFDVSGGADNFRIHCLNSGVLNVIRCDFGDFNTGASYTFRAESGELNFIGNTIDSIDANILLTYDNNASAAGLIEGNYIGDLVNLGSNGCVWIRGVSVGSVEFNYNVCGSSTASAETLMRNQGAIANAKGNYFINLSDVLNGTAPASASANSYIESESLALSGTGDVDLIEPEVDVSKLIAAIKATAGNAAQTGAILKNRAIVQNSGI